MFVNDLFKLIENSNEEYYAVYNQRGRPMIMRKPVGKTAEAYAEEKNLIIKGGPFGSHQETESFWIRLVLPGEDKKVDEDRFDSEKETVKLPPHMTGRDPSKPSVDIPGTSYTISTRGDDATTQQDARHLGRFLASVPNPLTKAAGMASQYFGQYDQLPTGEKVARAMGSAGAPSVDRMLRKPMKEQDIDEAGPFSYGAKKPRKGSVADLAAQKRKEQEKGKQPAEPQDQRVGVARVTKDVAESISVVDQDYDLDQMHLTLDIEGKKVSFTYWDYEEDFSNAERRDVFDQLQEQPWYKGLDHPTKMEILDAAYRAIRGLEPQEYRPTVGDEPLDEQGVAEGSIYKKDQDLSSIPTQELEAFVRKHWGGGVPTYGQGTSVQRAMRELRRRQKQGVAEGSAQDKLYKRHQELRKKSGLPDPDYYKELKASYDLPDEERYAKQKEIKQKYKVTNEDREQYIEELGRAGYEIVTESATLCPECGGAAYADRMLAEKQDACYHKVKSRYKVWPSAYASGALVKCRKKGAANWGNKSKK